MRKNADIFSICDCEEKIKTKKRFFQNFQPQLYLTQI